MMTPEAFIRGYIQDHEGGLSVDPADTGNWLNGVLVGSKYGVTGGVLAKSRGVKTITPAQMAALPLDEAVKIGVQMFYDAPNFDLLPWNQVTASVVDMGWGSGPGQAVKLLQRMIGAGDDGQIGPFTVRAFNDYLHNHSLEDAANAYALARRAFYEQIIAVRPSNAKYRNGWRNRTASFLRGTSWWKTFAA